MSRLIAYPEERALEDTALRQHATPSRIFGILLPVWSVDIKATITDGEPYDLIDRYLERGIAEGGLDTVSALADFFALDVVVVDRAVRFLAAIGHVQYAGDQLVLTELGQRSVRDQVRYTVTRQDRRRLYFDGFGSRPLTRPYYDSRAVTYLSAGEANEEAARREWPMFWPLSPMRGFRVEALAELARHPDRDHYNLPERIDSPQVLDAPDLVFLPMYLVRAAGPDGRIRYFTYTQVRDEADPDMSALCEQTPEIVGVLENELNAARSDAEQNRAREWLDKRCPGAYVLHQRPDGGWQATITSSAFRPGGVALSKLGSFVVLANGFFRVWCTDLGVRRSALLARIDSYLGARGRIEPAEAARLIAQIARQLDLNGIGLPEIRDMAASSGSTGVAAQLDDLIRGRQS